MAAAAFPSLAAPAGGVRKGQGRAGAVRGPGPVPALWFPVTAEWPEPGQKG